MTEKIVSKIDLISVLSEAVDFVSRELANHHKEVACIAMQLAEYFDLTPENKTTLLISTLIHDCGAMSYDRKNISPIDLKDEKRHSMAGYLLLKSLNGFYDVAKLIKYHHDSWDYGKLEENDESEKILIMSQIINLADYISNAIDRNKEILSQENHITEMIVDMKGKKFHPAVVGAYLEFSKKEYFWFNLKIPGCILHNVSRRDCANHMVPVDELYEFCHLFQKIIDFRSIFTSAHSKGVEFAAGYLAQKARFSEFDVKLMKISGLLHDIGKLAVPITIIEKEGALTNEEYNIIKTHTFYSHNLLQKVPGFGTVCSWSALHHEKLDGSGYPFHYERDELSLGSRIMTVSDIFVALSENRPYRPGISKNESVKILEKMNKDNKIDGDVLDLLKENIKEIDYNRTIVQMDTYAKYDKFLYQLKDY
ncbi:MAG: HD-GYP domain-containing protein [Candidatus Muiribacteriota bacterium]